ncbi:MAG: hypothetical protein A3F95_01660 [Candidatus Nealsonbacteria bacterium RIFCSPLOWO2_12_FULL_39_31]|uniref:Glycosyl transferase family 1 domain-containing protein n=2 Tax=Candidatus Nealsoniibacteriota TaxID=1817911 RepID=A0A1G2EP97_9BACT|nr:MAG: Glycosyl transferase group 1 [Parcubacteria group bacterium GW2011_GWA2_38_27]KKQ97255.1 MAG: Glycosyl transferase group 1 [Parcubacteria group bacterium GW2011_GWC2_39_11]OGZ19792.1 MAG: hypothetical protein A2626_02420 [Candidatus Nealsonbacteria bacterium RIFCSPHIGHO2_01_FULL_38_55]OGZ21714.1 MAG: hypothetical protein A3C48_00145 [Candidatus Nealsonbacteria bacterium RIFCSPHIGHO2_02_FULL_38_75]OGZ22160.1 MAG: hypothetical protein A2W55_00915 [Candidatus Nealsonbacteria bacterium RIFC
MPIRWIEISKKKYGGVAYNDEARNFLSKYFEVNLVDCEAKFFKKAKPFKLLESLFRLSNMKGEKDLWIRDFYSTLTLPFDKTKGKNLVVIHHLDFSGFSLFAQPFLNFLKIMFFFPALRKVNGIVTVSRYWQNYFFKKGYKNVYRIYNGFNLSDFNIQDKDILDFKEKYNFQDKPIIYLGNCQRAKGVVESYNALKGLDAYLVTSGREQIKIPARNLNLEYKNYLKLLKASSIVLAMSKFEEGWCRTAHEAMLCRTMVIGSGLGGMGELLEGGKQIVCRNFSQLREKAEYLLARPQMRKKMGEDGYDYAKNFTIERFNKEWRDMIKKIII